MRLFLTSIAAIALSGCATADMAPRTYVAADYSAALADPARPAEQRESDAARKPAELLAFARIDRGERVGDFIMGGGYLTRILAAAVGPQGHVYAFQPEEFIGFRPQYGTDRQTVAEAYANVSAIAGPAGDPDFPSGLDTVITVQNAHDLYLEAMPEGTATRAMSAIFGSLKPGGTLVIVDHSARAGTGISAANTLHRIDKAALVALARSAGFVLEGESDLFANAADPRTANVFDGSIRGNTDQFALRFRKPG
jgi:predicted methyltransferase